MTDDVRDQSEETFKQTLDDLLAEKSTSNAGSVTPESADRDPSLFTSEETSPFAADDLRSRAAQAPRTDKQGDVIPQQAGPDAEALGDE